VSALAAGGCGGVTVHPRIGLSPRIGYLTAEYFRLLRLVVEECARLGLRVSLYDEGSYPSGSACGQVVAADPGREFAWVVGPRIARWGYTFGPVDGGTEVVESWDFLDDGLAVFDERFGDDAAAQVADRHQKAVTGIPETLAAIKRAAEAQPAP
jgi:hypothetical protein